MNQTHANRYRRKPARWAILLLELGLAMALASVLLGVTLVLLASLLRAEPTGSLGRTTLQELDRFTDLLRHDLHRTQEIATPEPTELHLQTSTGEVVYELRDGQCLRRTQTDDRERMTPFPIDAEHWNLTGGQEPGQLVAIAFELAPQRTSRSPVPITVAAQLGKFTRNPASDSQEP